MQPFHAIGERFSIDRRALSRAGFGLGLAGLLRLDAQDALGKQKKHKKCKKRCKKNKKQCDKDCEILNTDVDLCKNDCQIAQKQCKKDC